MNISLSQKAKNSSSYLQYWLKTFRAGLTLLCVICLFVFPLLTQNTYYLSIFITPMIFTIFAASWDFLAGFAGQVSFGQSIFFGISAYITSYFLKYLQFNWGFSLIIGALVGVAVGLIVGIPSLRLKGPYLALATLMFSLILFQLFMMEQLTPFLGGTQGIPNVRPLSDNIVEVYFIYLIIMIICVLVMIWIGKSNFGTILKSIRDDDKGARASGINIAKYKIYAFMISGFFAGIAGGLFAMQNRGAGPSIFLPNYSFYAIVFAALGGIGTISGAGLGAFFFWLLYAFFQFCKMFLLPI
ncbi:MAG: branched-chain amino acid ABC transporter permease [Candidatus Lokiarchaeota archaeon]